MPRAQARGTLWWGVRGDNTPLIRAGSYHLLAGPGPPQNQEVCEVVNYTWNSPICKGGGVNINHPCMPVAGIPARLGPNAAQGPCSPGLLTAESYCTSSPIMLIEGPMWDKILPVRTPTDRILLSGFSEG